jgi:RHS repeat-associated protein
MAMDTTTQAISRKQYTPYGQIRGGASATWPDPTRGYLAKPVDAATGYTDLGARKYDPALGRFISPDPVLETSSPQQLGGYTYAADNPVTGSDPSGLRACLDSCSNSGAGGSSGSGNTDQGTSAADQCWGPGGNWICGSGSTGSGSSTAPVVYTCLPGTFGCSGPLQAQPSGPPSSSSGGGGLWHWVTHTALPALGKVTGVTDAIDCIKNPTWAGCTKAVVKLAVTGTVIMTAGSSLGVGASVDGTLGSADAAIQGGDAAVAAEGSGWLPSTSADLQAAVRGANKPQLSAVKRLACGIAALCQATVPGVTSSDVSAQWAIPASIKEAGPDIPEIAREIDSSSATGIGSGPGIIPEGGGIAPPSPTDIPSVWVGPWVP